MSAEDVGRIAIHEAGHAVVAVALGRTLGPVTIEGSDFYAGLTIHERVEAIPDVELAFTGPLPLMPAPVRQEFESRVCVSLAGDLAEDLRSADLLLAEEPTVRVRRRPDPVGQESSRADQLPGLPGLSSADLATIAEAQRPLTTDEQNTWAAAAAFVGASIPLEVTAAFVHYCRAVTRDLLARNWQAVTRLADALLERRTLSGEAARAIIFNEPAPPQ